MSCVAGAALGESCSVDSDCAPTNSHCDTNCICDSGYEDDGNGACAGKCLGIINVREHVIISHHFIVVVQVSLSLCVHNYATYTRIPNRVVETHYKYAFIFTHEYRIFSSYICGGVLFLTQNVTSTLEVILLWYYYRSRFYRHYTEILD